MVSHPDEGKGEGFEMVGGVSHSDESKGERYKWQMCRIPMKAKGKGYG